MSDLKPMPAGVQWNSPQWWEWYDSLDHSFCTHLMAIDGKYTSRTCWGMHCEKCGKSVSSQGHRGFCPADICALCGFTRENHDSASSNVDCPVFTDGDIDGNAAV